MNQQISRIGYELQTNLGDPFKGVMSLPQFLSDALSVLLLIGAMIVFVCLLWGGWQWFNAGGEDSNLQAAKNRLTHCLVGFAILTLSYAITLLVQYFLGIQVFRSEFGGLGEIPPIFGPPPELPDPNNPPPVCDLSVGNAGNYGCPACHSCFSFGSNQYGCFADPGKVCYIGTANQCTRGACSASLTCGEPTTYVCEDRTCQNDTECFPGRCVEGECVPNIVPNIASTSTCEQVCQNAGFDQCASVGTNAAGNNSQAYQGSDSSCSLSGPTINCQTVMNVYTPVNRCEGRAKEWTNCNCGSATPPSSVLACSAGGERLTSDPWRQGVWGVSGNELLLTDNRNGDWDVILKDYVTGTERQIAVGSGDQLNPVRSGDNIVWRDILEADLYSYNLTTGQQTRLTNDGSNVGEQNVKLDGRWVTWSGGGRIHVYDLTTGSVDTYGSSLYSNGEPYVWEDTLVWKAYGCSSGNCRHELHMANLLTKSDTIVETAPPSGQLVYRYPNLRENILAFISDLGITVLNLDTSERTIIPVANLDTNVNFTTRENTFRIGAGGKIFWTDNRNGEENIYMYDLNTGQETPVLVVSGNQRLGVIDGERLYFRDDRDGDLDVYVCQF